MTDAGSVYLYCILPTSPPARRGGLKGVCDQPVRYISHGRIAGAISLLPGEKDLGPSFPEGIFPLVVAHERVVEAMMAVGPVLPMRFGCVFSSEEAARSLLRERHDEFRSRLEGLSGKKEFGLRIYETPGEERGQEPLGERSLVGEQQSKQGGGKLLPHGGCSRRVFPFSPEAGGRAYFQSLQDKRKLRREARQRLADALRTVHERLAACAADSLIEPCHSVPLEQNTAEEATEVFRAAYLVENAAVTDFLRERVALEGEYGPKAGLIFACTGPWPPYHFV